MTLQTRIFLIFGATAAFIAVLFIGISWLLGNGEKAARHASAQFATAVVSKDASLAPKGAEEYIDGIRGRFGPVSSARVIDARNTSHGSGNNSHTYFVADVLLHTAKGPAVVELDFNGPSLTYSSETVTFARELAPVDVPDDSLSDPEFVALAKAFKARGGEAADEIDLSRSLPEAPAMVDAAPTPQATPSKQAKAEQRAVDKQMQDGVKRLACVKDAHGDIEKLTRCASI
jgi:hypothetical protein